MKNKTGSSIDRDELDERVPLYGDLDITGEVIRQIESDGQRYLHISASFTEKISIEMMQKIEQEMRDFYCSAYGVDELAVYSETHIPKIKYTIDPITGQKKLRLYHFHMIIPKTSMLREGYENPVGNYMYSVKYFQALQNKINAKYGLEAPVKGHGISCRSDVISKYTRLEELFKGQKNAIEFKEKLLEVILDKDLDYMSLKQYLGTIGEVKVRKAGKVGEYLWVKPDGEKSGVNLNDVFFMPSFSNLSKKKKEEQLDKECNIESDYKSVAMTNEPDSKDIELIDYWYEFRSKELRFLRNKKMIDEYQRLEDINEKREYLKKSEELYYSKHPRVEDMIEIEPVKDFRIQRGLRLKSKKGRKRIIVNSVHYHLDKSKKKNRKSNDINLVDLS
ncbi:MAG: hypothetical protein U9R50_11800 [Campylobacterota bacterium]|nr:hypothetical protein [Campylobacterota bacterium]